MKNEMKYITFEEQQTYEKLAKEYKIKGYSSVVFMTSKKDVPEERGAFKPRGNWEEKTKDHPF